MLLLDGGNLQESGCRGCSRRYRSEKISHIRHLCSRSVSVDCRQGCRSHRLRQLHHHGALVSLLLGRCNFLVSLLLQFLFLPGVVASRLYLLVVVCRYACHLKVGARLRILRCSREHLVDAVKRLLHYSLSSLSFLLCNLRHLVLVILVCDELLIIHLLYNGTLSVIRVRGLQLMIEHIETGISLLLLRLLQVLQFLVEQPLLFLQLVAAILLYYRQAVLMIENLRLFQLLVVLLFSNLSACALSYESHLLLIVGAQTSIERLLHVLFVEFCKPLCFRHRCVHHGLLCCCGVLAGFGLQGEELSIVVLLLFVGLRVELLFGNLPALQLLRQGELLFIEVLLQSFALLLVLLLVRVSLAAALAALASGCSGGRPGSCSCGSWSRGGGIAEHDLIVCLAEIRVLAEQAVEVFVFPVLNLQFAVISGNTLLVYFLLLFV